MSWLRRARTDTNRAPAAPSAAHEIGSSGSQTHSSLGFQTLIRNLPDQPAILDLGAATGANVRFFTERARYLRIADLQSAFLGGSTRPQEDPESLARTFARALPFAAGEHFDAVLAWDLLNYLRFEEIGAAMQRILPFLSPGAQLFALISFQKEIPAQPLSFRIQDETALFYGSPGGPTRPCPRHKLPDLVRQMPGFGVEHSFLLRNGMQEYVLTRQP